MRFILVLLMTLALTACLKTRSELRGETAGGLPVDGQRYPANSINGQQQVAQNQSRFFEIDNDFRQLYGKIEVLEKKISDIKEMPQATSDTIAPAEVEKIKALESRITTLEEALIAIDKKLTALSDKSANISVKKPTGPFGYGEMYFAQGKFEEAIAAYDNYRKKYPRGKSYAQATLKMGLAFQKLKMNQDAKAFYKEVIQKYPKTRVAVTAQKNLKKL